MSHVALELESLVHKVPLWTKLAAHERHDVPHGENSMNPMTSLELSVGFVDVRGSPAGQRHPSIG